MHLIWEQGKINMCFVPVYVEKPHQSVSAVVWKWGLYCRIYYALKLLFKISFIHFCILFIHWCIS